MEESTQGTRLPMLTEAQVREMQESGLVEFMPHTVSHPKLTDVEDGQAKMEIARSRAWVEEHLGMAADVFAYPYGLFDERHVRLLKEGGWQGAVTVREGLVYHDTDPYRLPRNAVDSETSFAQFRGKLSSAVEWYRMLRP